MRQVRPCADAPSTYPTEPVVNYVQGNMDTDYSTGNLEGWTSSDNYPIELTFASNDAALGAGADPTFAAIIFDSPNCGSGNILGVAGSPHYENYYSPPYDSPHDGILNSVIDASNPNAPILKIPALPNTFYTPHYYQDFACLDEDENPVSKCGKLKFCVEMQMLDECGRKLTLVDVRVEITFDLIENCEADFCGEVILERNKIVEESEEVELGDITCQPCGVGAELFGSNSLPSITVGQGSAVDLCINVVPDIEGVCIYEILSLQLEVTRPSNPSVKVNFPILPQGLSLIAYSPATRSNPDYKPLQAYYDINIVKIDTNGTLQFCSLLGTGGRHMLSFLHS